MKQKPDHKDRFDLSVPSRIRKPLRSWLAIFAATCGFAMSASHASATGYVVGNDINPRVGEGRIVTDAIDHDTFDLVSDVRHFAYTLGGTPNNPYFTSNPGFNALAGSGLPQGQQLRFDLHRKLVRWDGTGVVDFGDISTGETLRFQFGSASAVATGTSALVAGFSMGNIGSGGSIHRHLNAFLEGATPPAVGLYFTVLRLSVSNGAAATSDALYIAYNNGLASADADRGMAYLSNPTPGDTNFDSKVDFDDLLTLAQNYSTAANASWFDGDFNRDRVVNFDDLLALAQNYGSASMQSGGGFAAGNFSGDWALARSIVPEPTSAAVVIAGLALSRPRKRI